MLRILKYLCIKVHKVRRQTFFRDLCNTLLRDDTQPLGNAKLPPV